MAKSNGLSLPEGHLTWPFISKPWHGSFPFLIRTHPLQLETFSSLGLRTPNSPGSFLPFCRLLLSLPGKLIFFCPISKHQFPRTWFILSSLFSLHTLLSWSPSLLWLLSITNMLTSLKCLLQASSNHSLLCTRDSYIQLNISTWISQQVSQLPPRACSSLGLLISKQHCHLPVVQIKT